MTTTETIIRRHIAQTAKSKGKSPEDIDLTANLKQEFGISSMKLILLMTALCKEFDVLLSSFDERDLAVIDRGEDLIRVFEKVQEGAAS